MKLDEKKENICYNKYTFLEWGNPMKKIIAILICSLLIFSTKEVKADQLSCTYDIQWGFKVVIDLNKVGSNVTISNTSIYNSNGVNLEYMYYFSNPEFGALQGSNFLITDSSTLFCPSVLYYNIVSSTGGAKSKIELSVMPQGAGVADNRLTGSLSNEGENEIADTIGFCKKEGILKSFRFLGRLLYVVKVIVPIILIIIGSIHFGKALVSSNQDAVQKAAKSFAIKLGAGVVVFLLPTVIYYFFGLFPNAEDYSNCSTCLFHPEECQIVKESESAPPSTSSGNSNNNSQNSEGSKSGDSGSSGSGGKF